MAGLFSKYRAWHEFMFPETTKAISDYRTGVISKQQFVEFVCQRDQKGNLEMDSASFNFMYLDILAEQYPKAKFIVTVRDCYSWLDSMINMLLVLNIQDWIIDYGSRSFGIHIAREMFVSRESVLRALPDLLDGLLGYWAYGAGVTLDNLPQGRFLIVKTDEISGSLDKIAKFIEIPTRTLVREKSHLFVASKKFNILHDMDFGLLKNKFEYHCAPLMKKLFPDRSLEAFLENQKPDRLQSYDESAFRQDPVNKRPWHKTSQDTVSMGDHLLSLIKKLDINFAFERSLKIFEKTLIGNRLVYGIHKKEIGEKAHETILDLCRQVNMPEEFREIVQRNLKDVEVTGWAIEEMDNATTCKMYLDFMDKWKREVKATSAEIYPFLLYLGFKWDAVDETRRGRARYTWYPSLPLKRILERLANLLDVDINRDLFEVAKGLLETALSKVAYHDIVYVEVTEDNSPRKSFDINLCGAKLLLKQIYPFLQRICRHYSIPDEEFHALYNPHRSMKFGHLSGGIDRRGKDFATLYFGAGDITRPKET